LRTNWWRRCLYNRALLLQLLLLLLLLLLLELLLQLLLLKGSSSLLAATIAEPPVALSAFHDVWLSVKVFVATIAESMQVFTAFYQSVILRALEL